MKQIILFPHPKTAINANGYRSLEEGEKVCFRITDSDKGKVAVLVTSRDGGTVKGASRKSRLKKGARKYTNKCFNCNAIGHRVKSCPYDRKENKTCHNCGSLEHLILKCPKLEKSLKIATDKLTDEATESSSDVPCTMERSDNNDKELTIHLDPNTLIDSNKF